MYDEEAWEEYREEVLAYMRSKEETLIKDWLNSIGYKFKEPIGYYRNSFNNTMEIYTTKPGMLIGRAGIHVEQLKKMLSSEFYGEWSVKFIEIRGGFVNI